MRWAAKDYTQWHNYRPWLPVKLKGEWVWFERILRRGWATNTIRGGTKYSWEYANSEFDLLKDSPNLVQGSLVGQAASVRTGGVFPESGQYVSTASHQAALGQLNQKRARNTKGTI